MADELKEKLTEASAKAAEASATETNKDGDTGHRERTESRIQDLLTKLQDATKGSEEKDRIVEQLKKEKSSLEFDKSFRDVQEKFPYAKDYRTQIEEKVAAGMTLDDATTLILAKQGKLVDAETAKKATAEAKANGGSADTTIATGEKKAVKDMSQAEILSELKNLAQSGQSVL